MKKHVATGKYIKLQYDEDFRLVGARTEHFLLEKSRLVHLEDSERSYHILYQVSPPPSSSRGGNSAIFQAKGT